MWFRLTLALGHDSVETCQRHIDSYEFTEWKTFFKLEPFGPYGDDLRLARFMSMYANANSDKSEKFKPKDFLPRSHKDTRDTQEELTQKIKKMQEMYNKHYRDTDS